MGHEGGGQIVVGVVNLQNTLRTPMSEASDDVLMQHGVHIQASRIALALCFPMFLRCSCLESKIRLEITHQHKKSMCFFTPNLRFQCMFRNCEKMTIFLKVASNHQEHAISMQELRFSPPAFSIPSSFRMPHLFRFHWN